MLNRSVARIRRRQDKLLNVRGVKVKAHRDGDLSERYFGHVRAPAAQYAIRHAGAVPSVAGIGSQFGALPVNTVFVAKNHDVFSFL
jgi:hypothetical protein